ncbi:hypothetical protein KPATCC21470_1394 [Kitasatospora purpeofusca]
MGHFAVPAHRLREPSGAGGAGCGGRRTPPGVLPAPAGGPGREGQLM